MIFSVTDLNKFFARCYYNFIFSLFFNCCIWVLATECCNLPLRLFVSFLPFTNFCSGMANVLSTLKLSFLHSFFFLFLLHFSLLFSLLLFRRYSFRPRKEQNSYSSWARYDMFFVCYYLISETFLHVVIMLHFALSIAWKVSPWHKLLHNEYTLLLSVVYLYIYIYALISHFSLCASF